MSKFLEIVENNNPEVDLDSITEVKRELQRMLIKMGISAKASFTNNILYVTLPDKRVVELEVKNVKAAREEEAEDPTATVSAITAIAGLPDQGLGKQMMSSTSRKLQLAKRNMADAAEKISKKFLTAASS
jgi:hypothetical protein